MDFLFSFFSVSVAWAILSTILPAGGTGKSVKILVSFTLCLSLLFLGAEAISGREFVLPDLSFAVDREAGKDDRRLALMAVENALSEKVANLIEGYTGTPPSFVDCEVSYDGERFVPEKIIVAMPDLDKVSVFARLASELAIDYGCIELREVS